ncbi:NUDIX domain-containing protein [Streptomyces sp. NPDC006465]|uniref:NUDIX domain-containing protein n=1 Tax=Streptomyces sp. NPDC006465 TaxID=3157174 RepID=UPI0033A52B36
MSTGDGGFIAGAVVTHAGRVLLIRRTAPAGSVLWTYPSGKVEGGESVEEAAAREALEEAAVMVEPVSLLGERVHPVTGWRVAYVACRLLSGEARPASPREVAEVAWLRLVDIPHLVPGELFGPAEE